MKKSFFIGLLLCQTSIVTPVLAQVVPQVPPPQVTPLAPATLAAVMKAMSTNLKKVAAQAQDVTQNAASEKLVLDLVELTKNSKNHVPDKVKALPKAEQEARLQEYIKMLDDMIVVEMELASAFHNNDNVRANDMLTKLSAAKKDGHVAFK